MLRCPAHCPPYRFSSAVFKYRDAWAIVVRGNYVFDRKSGPSHRLDLTFKQIGDAAARSLPHGIIGQSFSTNGPRHGKRDVYPSSGRIATSAMAEGAIEGDAAMYEVARPYATEFAFSRFMSAAPAEEASPSGLLLPGEASSTARGGRFGESHSAGLL